ncbi:MAG TPA: ATP-binding protein [Candidatus Limnocylindrales bacterium]|nr:ATP-binding protein [Candidatus Limnocylindrales bacterium]
MAVEVAGDPLLVEAQRAERAFGRIRLWAGVLAIALGPFFPNLSTEGVLALGVGVIAYDLVALRASAAAQTARAHARVAWTTFGADLLALSIAMFLFSSDRDWTTYFIGTLVITGASFRFGERGGVVAAAALGVAYVAISLFRDVQFGYTFTTERVAFHLSVFALTALLANRLLRDARWMRAEREALIVRLRRRIAEEAAIARALRVVASVAPGPEVVPALLEASRGVFGFERATVFVPDPESGEYRVQHRLRGHEEDPPPPPRIAVGEGLIGAALREDRVLLVPNVLADDRYVPSGAKERARSVIVAPLRVGGRPVAALTLSRAHPDQFGSDDLRLAETVAGLVAQVLESERLFAEASEAEALRATDRLKDEFLAAVSHELRTPLTVVSGALELLDHRRTELRADAAARLIEQARRNVDRLQRHVEDLLDLAQLRQARIELAREFVKPAALLAEVAAAHEVMSTAKRQTLLVRCPDDVGPVLVDRRRMAQVLGNLVANAIRYSPEAGNVTLRGERRGSEVRLVVEDDGPGIPPAERDRVFDKFYRLDRDRRSGGGTGLGLAIARTLVDLHGGRIWVEAVPAGGSAFVVSLAEEAMPAGVAAG